MQRVLDTLGSRDADAVKLADIICRLVIDGQMLGELADRVVTAPDGAARTIKVPRSEWFDRLDIAIERGALKRMSDRAILTRLLTPPEEAA